ncbi:MAG: hypothetical protein MUC79_12585 [Thiobacillaceae bacterium]|jgi:hypothetical protein|nr:hypothetical protein [Thiobacillaceae bacterium]
MRESDATPPPATTPAAPAAADAATDTERRAALAKLGTLAAWTAPTLMTLLISPRAVAEYLPGPPGSGS